MSVYHLFRIPGELGQHVLAPIRVEPLAELLDIGVDRLHDLDLDTLQNILGDVLALQHALLGDRLVRLENLSHCMIDLGGRIAVFSDHRAGLGVQAFDILASYVIGDLGCRTNDRIHVFDRRG